MTTGMTGSFPARGPTCGCWGLRGVVGASLAWTSSAVLGLKNVRNIREEGSSAIKRSCWSAQPGRSSQRAWRPARPTGIRLGYWGLLLWLAALGTELRRFVY
jgi:hypothetical protein